MIYDVIYGTLKAGDIMYDDNIRNEKLSKIKSDGSKKKQTTIYRNRRNKNSFLNFEFAGKTLPTEDYKSNYDNERYTSFEYVISGRMIIEKDGIKHEAGPGDTYILKAGCNADYYSATNKIEKIYFSVRGELLDALMDLYKLNDVTVIHCDTREIIENIHDFLISSVDSADVTKKLSLLLHELIMQLSSAINSVDYSFDPGYSIEEQFKSFCDSRRNFEYSLKTFASQFRTTEKHLISVFKKKYGITPYAYFTKKRIEYAKELLERTSLSVGEIASKLYYDSTGSFSHAFKKHVGEYPAEYRKNFRS